MQRYQVFIDEHLILFEEKTKSNQQFESIFKLFEPSYEDIQTVIKWLHTEKNSKWTVCLISENKDKLWETFKSSFKFIKAAGGLVKNANDEYLFIFRFGKWDLPKGKMEKGETQEESALREVEEECGITQLELRKQLPSTYHVYFHKENFVLKITYWFEMNYTGEEELIPQLEESIESARWFSANEFQEVHSNTYASLKNMISSVA